MCSLNSCALGLGNHRTKNKVMVAGIYLFIYFLHPSTSGKLAVKLIGLLSCERIRHGMTFYRSGHDWSDFLQDWEGMGFLKTFPHTPLFWIWPHGNKWMKVIMYNHFAFLCFSLQSRWPVECPEWGNKSCRCHYHIWRSIYGREGERVFTKVSIVLWVILIVEKGHNL